MKKLFMMALLAGGVVWFVGSDAVSSAFQQARTAAREALTKDVPLENQLAEARSQVDAYAESIIRGEVAAENLDDMIEGVAREVRALTVRVETERKALVAMRADLGEPGHGQEIVPTSVPLRRDRGDRDGALRRVHAFRASSSLLARRQNDLERLRKEHAQTLSTLQKARGERMRLSEEMAVLAAELQSLQARKAAARTRRAVGDAGVDRSGYAEAHERVTKIRNKIREQNKLLRYYEVERVATSASTAVESLDATAVVQDPAQAIDEALAAYPAQ